MSQQLENLKKLSVLIANQLPDFVRDDHETFVALLEAYYEYMEQDTKAIATGRNLIEAQDIDTTFPEFLEHFYNNFIPLFPKETLGDRILFLKHARKFYRAKGTEKSFKLLFRLLFNENVVIRYPKKNILIASGGKWAIEQSLRIIPDNVATFVDPTGFIIIGEDSNASATIQKFKTFSFFGNTIYELFISNIVGNFISSERFIVEGIDANGNTFIAFEGNLDGTVSSFLIVDAGSGYSAGDPVPISGGGGVGATARVSRVSTGELQDFTIIESGSGYPADSELVFTSPTGSGARAIVTAISNDKQHPTFIYLNTDILGTTANVLFNAATFHANATGTVNIAANSNVVIGTLGLGVANTNFLTQLGANTPLNINGNIAYVVAVANNRYCVVDRPFESGVISNANVQVALPLMTGNVNTSFSSLLTFSVRYGPIGPINTIVVQDPGEGYSSAPQANVGPTQNVFIPEFGNVNVSSTIIGYVRNLGIVGAVRINSGGTGYIEDDELVFTVPVSSGARNAGGYVNEVDENGTIISVLIDHARINGRVNILTTSPTVIGTGTAFNTQVQIGDIISVYGDERTVVNVINATFINVNSAFSTNNPNARVALVRDMPGGLGYSIFEPPTITVTSATGANANIVLLNTLASGENLLPTTNAGAIQAIQITNPGTRYRSNAVADMSGLGDGNAELVPLVVAGIFNYTGYYIDSSSFLSSSSKLQNRDYYQNFSYVLRSRIPLDRYQVVLKRLLHPAGMIQFSEVIVDSMPAKKIVTETYISTNQL